MKNKKVISVLISAAIAGVSVITNAEASPNKPIPKGWLVWHSYSSYSAMDSSLYVRFPNGKIKEITGNFVHPMNGSFSVFPYEIVFMAIDPAADEWDIFKYSLLTDEAENLTQNSGFRNEDPKFSPDGKKIYFKRGYWSREKDDFVYNLAEINPETGNIKMLTDDMTEESMPCASEDGKKLYYADYSEGISSVYSLDLTDGTKEKIWGENGITAYYPVTFGEKLYFTKWHSESNKTDSIVQYKDGKTETLAFNSSDYNCSDACPTEEGIFYSSTQNGSYDLYYYDGESSYSLNELNTEKNELGAAFYSFARYDNLLTELQDNLLEKLPQQKNFDLNNDGITNSMDMALLRIFGYSI